MQIIIQPFEDRSVGIFAQIRVWELPEYVRNLSEDEKQAIKGKILKLFEEIDGDKPLYAMFDYESDDPDYENKFDKH